jgi:hypothetical protein
VSEPTESIRHLGTHRKLVSQAEHLALDTMLTLDAIIVPASRPAENLEQAITLARALHCMLLILCSHYVEPADVHQLLAKRSFYDAIVVDLPDDYYHELLDFPGLASIKDDLPEACSWYVTDLSTKRNVGVILARMLGWQRIFFLDDDIRDINPADVTSVVSTLGSYATAGLRVTDYPDNSAACHAHRDSGGLQDVFVTGAALAVDCRQNTGFFPDMYNEDWLFFYDVAAAGRLGSSRRKVTQLRYNPFADPKRAAWQEFGDVLAEGLYALLDQGLDWQYATDGYWLHFLDARRRFLEAIVSRADTARPEIREQLLLSVEMALKCSISIGPGLLERYILLWRQDLRNWQQRIGQVRPMPSLDAALGALGLEQLDHGRVAEVAHPGSGVLTEEPPTVPFTLRDLYELRQRDMGHDGRATSGQGKRGGRNRWTISVWHHGSPGVRQDGFFATARRAFWASERECAPTESSPTPDAQPAEPVCS